MATSYIEETAQLVLQFCCCCFSRCCCCFDRSNNWNNFICSKLKPFFTFSDILYATDLLLKLILVIDFLVLLALLLENMTLFPRQLLFAKSCIFLVLRKWCSLLNYLALLLNMHKLNKQFHWRNDVLCGHFTLRSCRSQFDKISDLHFVKWRKPNRTKLKYQCRKKFIWMVTTVFHQHADSKGRTTI